jgi:energy-converting hydrogenase Eha subunit A
MSVSLILSVFLLLAGCASFVWAVRRHRWRTGAAVSMIVIMLGFSAITRAVIPDHPIGLHTVIGFLATAASFAMIAVQARRTDDDEASIRQTTGGNSD